MDRRLEIIRGICILVSLTLLGGAILIRWYQSTKDNPKVLTNKILLTLFLGALAFFSVPLFGWLGPFVIVFFGVVFSILWTPNIGSLLVSPITDMIDGGNDPIELKPYYSIARGLRARGSYDAAIAAVEKQLRIFPDDFEGQLLLAEIQVANLQDSKAAEATIANICQSPKQSKQHIAAALNALADWHLKFAKDHIAARQDLEQLIALCPDSEAALGAAQRIAHLGAEEKPWSLIERKKIPMAQGIQNYGLQANPPDITPKETGPDVLAEELVRHLESHPQDAEAREKLAVIYAEHYQRLDLAEAQLEQLIAQPNVNARTVAHWLNLIADMQIRFANNFEAAKSTLQRIIERFPSTPLAELAQNRIDLLRLEVRGKEKSQAVKLGSYEQNIGLKYGRPKSY